MKNYYNKFSKLKCILENMDAPNEFDIDLNTVPELIRPIVKDWMEKAKLYSDPNTSPEKLSEILNSKESVHAQKYAFINPNVSAQDFKNHAHKFTDSIHKNPSLNMWTLENPAFLHEMPPYATKLWLDHHAEIDPDHINVLRSHPHKDVREKAEKIFADKANTE